MDTNVDKILDKMSKGRFSETKRALESMTLQNSYLTSENSYLTSENSYLKSCLSVVTLYLKGMNPEEISATKRLGLEEVKRILRENGEDV
jgi:regulator of replication initiation timing